MKPQNLITIVTLLILPFLFLFTCKKYERVPAVTTDSISVSDTAIIAHGTVVDIGKGNSEDTATVYGFCWTSTGTPTFPSVGGGSAGGVASKTGDFQSNISGLKPSTKYNIRAYISTIYLNNNSPTISDTKYGEVKSFTTPPLSKPTVATAVVSSITPTTATCGGNVTDEGVATVTSLGVCYSTSHNPTTADSLTSTGTGTGSFTSSITALTANTTYYVRAYATNCDGTAYGDQINFTTLDFTNCGTVTDADGNVYSTVQIGDQCWMAENLKVTKYPGGSSIPLVTDNTTWGNLADNSTDDAYCYYNNNASGEANTYGALYTWAAAMGDNAVSSSSNPSGVQGVCPTGWHLPSGAEWTELIDYLGGESVAGGKMKEAGTIHWNSPNTGADNSSGFSALPGGSRSSNGTFTSFGYHDKWWSATEYDATTAWQRRRYYVDANILSSNSNKSYGFSVRCLRDF